MIIEKDIKKCAKNALKRNAVGRFMINNIIVMMVTQVANHLESALIEL